MPCKNWVGFWFYFYVPEDAEDHNSCGKRDEGNTVADGVANLHLPEKPSLLKKKHQYKSWWKTNKQKTVLQVCLTTTLK